MAIKKKAATKKASAKKSATGKAASAKATSAKAGAKAVAVKAVSKNAGSTKPIGEAYSKTQFIADLCERTGIAKKDVNTVLNEIGNIIHGHIRKKAAGSFTMPGLLKIVTVKKPAQKARKNVPNPFRPGEFMDVPAKPARTVLKVRPLRRLKDMAAE